MRYACPICRDPRCLGCIDLTRKTRLIDTLWIEAMIVDPNTRPRVAKALRRFLDRR